MTVPPLASARWPTAIHVGFACTNRCAFCAQGDLRHDEPTVADDHLEGELTRLAAAGVRAVAFVGGEPTLHDGLPSWIGRARDAGFASVLVQTNGRRLAYPAYVNALRDTGLEAVEVSIAGPRSDVHEYHTRVPGSFRQTVAGITGTRRAGLDVGLTFVATRSSFRHLAEVVEQATRWGVQALHVACARPLGSALTDLGRMVPRFEAMQNYLIRSAEVADTLGVPLLVSGAPLCQIPGLERRALSVLRASGPDDAARFGEPCAECELRRSCPGLEAAYADRYGFGELCAQPELDRARPDRAANAAADRAYLFAGLGRVTVSGPDASQALR